MQVDWSDLALDDLDDVCRYIAKDSPYYAREFAERIFATTDRLKDFPLSGRMVPEIDNTSIREVIVQSYRVMYRVEQVRVLILAVIHGSRHLNNMKVDW
jgi:hypothetical protein